MSPLPINEPSNLHLACVWYDLRLSLPFVLAFIIFFDNILLVKLVEIREVLLHWNPTGITPRCSMYLNISFQEGFVRFRLYFRFRTHTYNFCAVIKFFQCSFTIVSWTLCIISLLTKHERRRRTWGLGSIHGLSLRLFRDGNWVYKTIRSSFIKCPSSIECSYSVMFLYFVRLRTLPPLDAVSPLRLQL